MANVIKIDFSSEESHKLTIYLHFLNEVENEEYDLVSTCNKGLPEEQWIKLLEHLKKSHILVHPNKDGLSNTLDLSDVKEKIAINIS